MVSVFYPCGEDNLSGWKYRKGHKINGSSDGTLVDYIIKITVYYGSGTDSSGNVYCNGKCKTNFADIRFTGCDGSTLLNYYLEKKIDGVSGTFFIKVPTIDATNGAIIFVYYGNELANTLSDDSGVFLVSEDFEGYGNGKMISGAYFRVFYGNAGQMDMKARGESYYPTQPDFVDYSCSSSLKKVRTHLWLRWFNTDYEMIVQLGPSDEYNWPIIIFNSGLIQYKLRDVNYNLIDGNWGAYVISGVWTEFIIDLYIDGVNSYQKIWMNGNLLGTFYSKFYDTPPINMDINVGVAGDECEVDGIYCYGIAIDEPSQAAWDSEESLPKGIVDVPYSIIDDGILFDITYGLGADVEQVEIDKEYVSYTGSISLSVPSGEISEYMDHPIYYTGTYIYRFRTKSYSDLYSDYFYKTVEYSTPGIKSPEETYLTATVYRCGIKLEWTCDEFADAVEYVHIYRKLSEDYELLEVVPGDRISWIDNDRPSDATYHYAIVFETYAGLKSNPFCVEVYATKVEPQIELSGRGGMNAIRHAIYTSHNELEGDRSTMEFNIWKGTEANDASIQGTLDDIDLILTGASTIEIKNLEPFSGETYICGSETRYWKELHSKESKSDLLTSGRIALWSGEDRDILSEYDYRVEITIEGSTDGELTDYQINLLLFNSSGTNSGNIIYLNNHSKNWPYDIRFTDEKGVVLSFFREENDAADGTWWVKVPVISAAPNETKIYLYYGNSGGEDNSDGKNTFILFDTCDNLDNWNSYSSHWGLVRAVEGRFQLFGFQNGDKCSIVSKIPVCGSSGGVLFKYTYTQLLASYRMNSWISSQAIPADVDAPSDNYDAVLNWTNAPAEVPVHKCVDGGTTMFSLNLTAPSSGDHKIEHLSVSEYQQIKVDGSIKSTQSATYDFGGEIYIGFGAQGKTLPLRSAEFYIDNIMVAKQALNAPLISAGEETDSSIPPTHEEDESVERLNLIAEAEEDYVALYWTEIPLATEYDIYKADREGDFSLLDTVTGTSYAEYSLPVLDLNFYKVVALEGTETICTSSTVYAMTSGTEQIEFAAIGEYRTGPWYGSYGEWSYRKKHTITGSTDASLSNYQIKFTVHEGNGVDSGTNVYCHHHCNGDFSDLRFTTSDMETPLDYWIETYTASMLAEVWVEVDSLPISPGTKNIYIYYGNGTAVSVSNGDNTFLFFDDFPGSTLDSNKWAQIGAAHTYYVSNSRLYITNKASGDWGTIEAGFRAKQSGGIYNPPNNGIAMEMKSLTWSQGPSSLAVVGPLLNTGYANSYFTTYFGDGWGSSTGEKAAATSYFDHAEEYHSGAGTLGASGTAELMMTKDLSNRVSHYWDGVKILGPHTHSAVINYMWIHTNKFQTYAMGTFSIDKIILRAFTANSPQNTSWGEEETYPTVPELYIAMNHAIYTTHTEVSENENKMIFSIWSPEEEYESVSHNPVMILTGTSDVSVVHILPLENEIYNIGRDDNRWLLSTGSQMYNDIAQTKTLKLHSGR